MQSDGRIHFKFRQGVTRSFLCAGSQDMCGISAARAQRTYPVLSAKRRHQLRRDGHRVGGAEYLRSHRQSACSEHEGSAAASPLRLVRAAHVGGGTRHAGGTHHLWLSSIAQRPVRRRRYRGADRHLLGKRCDYHLKRYTLGIPCVMLCVTDRLLLLDETHYNISTYRL